MDGLLKDFDLEPKNPSEEALRRWRSLVSIVKNRRRRFRNVADLVKRAEAEKKKRSIQSPRRSRAGCPISCCHFARNRKIRVALYVQKAALQFIDAAGRTEYKLSGVGLATEGWPKGLYDDWGSYFVYSWIAIGSYIEPCLCNEKLCDRALVRHLSACETMVSANCICTDKTGYISKYYSEVVKDKEGKLPFGNTNKSALIQFARSQEAVQTCLAAGITVRMVTGDNINTAKAKAKDAVYLHQMVMARSLPLDKHTLILDSLWAAGPEVAKENADVIILDDNFSTIVNVAKWGRAVYINIQKFVQFQLTVNVVALFINFFSACISGSAPLTAVQLLWVNMIMDTLGALALATEPPNDGLMKRPPVGRGESFITNIMWRNIIGQSIYQLIILLALYFKGTKLLGLTGSDATDVLNTVIFNSFVFCQVFNEINSREMEKINVFRGIFSSWMFIGIIVVTVAFQVIIVEFLGTFASTVPLSWQLWVLSVVIGAISMPLAVVIKFIPVKNNSPKRQHHNGYDLLPSGPDLA
ncbi:calcium-transporting ATPase 4, plasma membrane-type-like [Pistacia vera]|uniref:calcium-transporting ATPase 4, plasma membrane-type-like n=1 Tax=Pistacia vera TaxID=55513 RepID=UPI001262B90D|nr:calcium-transporting ATPase 4, plasma membrane-type-like [Pistacia vera]